MDKKVYFLKDLQEGCIDAMIIATKSTVKEVQESINKAKENDDYTWEDIVASLPEDCEIYDKWGKDGEIYY